MKSLKIALLSELECPTVTAELVPALQERGHQVAILNLAAVGATDFVTQPEIQALLAYDLVYYRSGLDPDESPERIFLLETFLKEHSVTTVNLHYTKHPLINSKTYEAKLAKKHGLLTPDAVYTAADFSVVSHALGLPFILKTDLGTNGFGVHLIQTATAFAEKTADYPDTKVIFQALVQHDFEYRVHVIAGEVVCLYKKSTAAGEFRSNVAQGGQMQQADSQYIPELTKLAEHTAAIFDFEITVADFMLDKNSGEFYFTEMNVNPGWQLSNKQITGIDVTNSVIEYFEKLCS